MTQFRNDILANNILVRDAIKSENFVSGVSGWSVERDGTAEFYDIVARGSVSAVELDIDNRNHPTGDRGRLHAFQDSLNLDQRIDWTIGQDNIDDQLGDTPAVTEKHEAQILHDIDTANEAPRILLSSGSFDQFLGSYVGILEIIGQTADRDIGTSVHRRPRVLLGPSTWLESSRMRPIFIHSSVDENITNTSFQRNTQDIGTSFIAPPSGMVKITLTASMEIVVSKTANSYRTMFVTWEVTDSGGGIVQGASHDQARAQSGDGEGATAWGFRSNASVIRPLSGLTPGDTYDIETQSRVTSPGGLNNATVFFRSLMIEPTM